MPEHHEVVISFEDGCSPTAKLICPASGEGCRPASFCPECYSAITESGCECCDFPPDDGCWIKSWFDNLAAEEILHGSVRVQVDARWNGESIEAHIVGPTPAETSREDS